MNSRLLWCFPDSGKAGSRHEHALTKRAGASCCREGSREAEVRGWGVQVGHPQHRLQLPGVLHMTSDYFWKMFASLLPHSCPQSHWDTQEPPNWASCLSQASTNHCPHSSRGDVPSAEPPGAPHLHPRQPSEAANSAASGRGWQVPFPCLFHRLEAACIPCSWLPSSIFKASSRLSLTILPWSYVPLTDNSRERFSAFKVSGD